MRIDLHCHTKATKTGDSPKRNIEIGRASCRERV